MEKPCQNFIQSAIIKRSGTNGSLRVFDWRETDPILPALTLMVEIETSDKENEKIITTLSEVLADQFFNAPTETIEFAFESALAKANIAIKDTLLIKPKNWLNKIHILVIASKEQEVHISSVGRMHAFLVHRDQIIDVINNNGNEGSIIRTPNPVKLFSNITSGRLLAQDSLVLTNESVLDYLSPERIRKTAQEFEPKGAINKLKELLIAAPANKQFGLAVIKRLPIPSVATINVVVEKQIKIEAEDTPDNIVEKYLKPEQTIKLNIDQEQIIKKITDSLISASKIIGKISGRYLQIGLTISLNFFSSVLEKIQIKLSALGPILAKSPRFILTLWSDKKARHYHLNNFKNSWQNKISQKINYFKNLSKKKKAILISLVAVTLILIASISTRARNQAQTQAQLSFQNNSSEITQKIDQAEASLIYRDETRTRQLMDEIKNILAKMPQDNREQADAYRNFQTRLDALNNTIEKKTILNNLSPIATISPTPNINDSAGLILIDSTPLYYNGSTKRIDKIDLNQQTLTPITLANDTQPFKIAINYNNQTIALLNETNVGYLNIESGAILNKNLAPTDVKISGIFTSYAKNLYTFSTTDNAVIRYREGGENNPEKWLKENYNLSSALDIAIDGSIYILTDNAINVLLNGRQDSVINLALETKLGPLARFYTNENIQGFYILDPDNKRILHISKKGELYNQYIAEQFKDARGIIVDKEEKNMLILIVDKIYRVEILPPV